MSMDRHAAVEPLLTDYVLGELDAAKRRDVEAHVATCAACAEEPRALNIAFHSIGLAHSPPRRLRISKIASSPVGRRLPAARDPATKPPALDPVRVWLAAAAALALGFGALLALSMIRTGQLNEALRQAVRRARRAGDKLAQNETQADIAVEILTAGDMRRIDPRRGTPRARRGARLLQPDERIARRRRPTARTAGRARLSGVADWQPQQRSGERRPAPGPARGPRDAHRSRTTGRCR